MTLAAPRPSRGEGVRGAMNGGRQRTRLDWHVVQVAVHFSFASNNRRAPRATPRARIDESPTVDSI